ncbi:MAG TPA: TetR/AcrR family transcriptional regulator [Ramlibacter sp.]|nr:TetR/AcrR family transcriptional regulator [Ramlibacter sp.]
MTQAPPSVPQRILDAAEALFAKQGYYAATIRDITDAAGVQLSLSRYHFGSKDELFKQVIGRRAKHTCDQLDASLSLAMDGLSPGADALTAIVDAMVSVPVRQLASGDTGWRNYLELLAHVSQLRDRQELLLPFRGPYTDTLRRYRLALRQALPDAPSAVLDWGLHFLQILVGHAILDLPITRWMEGVDGGQDDGDGLRRHLVAHVVGGIRAQMGMQAQGHDGKG